MMHNPFNKVWLFGAILYFIFSCAKKESVPIVARVGDKTITLTEFRDIYQFNPALAVVKNDLSAKKILLNSLIAEKLLALAAIDNGLDKKPTVRLYMEQFKREALIEKFWQDTIFPKADVSEEEFLRAYRQSKQKRVIQYLMYENENEAQSDYSRLEQGVDFIELAKLKGFSEQTLPVDTIGFKTPLPNIQSAVFKMNPNEVHPPLKEGNYYFIIKLTNVISDAFRSKDDFERLKPHLAKIIKKRKSASLFRQYIKTHFKKAPYTVDTKVFKKMARLLDAQLFPENKQGGNQFSFDLREETPLGEISGRPIVRFNSGEVWDVKTLLQRMEVSPYPIELKSPARFRLSILAAAKHILDDEIIAKEAEKSGLDKTQYVKIQQQMWGDFLLFEMEKARLLKGRRTPGQREAAVDSLLGIMMNKIKIQIYSVPLDTISVPRTDMFVFKTRFPRRTIVPVLEIINLPKMRN